MSPFWPVDEEDMDVDLIDDLAERTMRAGRRVGVRSTSTDMLRFLGAILAPASTPLAASLERIQRPRRRLGTGGRTPAHSGARCCWSRALSASVHRTGGTTAAQPLTKSIA
jgi:hypothetical protein